MVTMTMMTMIDPGNSQAVTHLPWAPRAATCASFLKQAPADGLPNIIITRNNGAARERSGKLRRLKRAVGRGGMKRLDGGKENALPRPEESAPWEASADGQNLFSRPAPGYLTPQYGA